MDISFKNLTPDLADDFFDYFENQAFPPGDPRSACYCLESHLKEEDLYTDESERRRIARELIDKGTMTGFLMYDGSRPVGWCNTGDKAGYLPVSGNEEYLTTGPEEGKIKILYCIDIAEDCQGKGLARLALEKVLADAKAEGYRYVEGYPFLDGAYPWQYHGPVRLYENLGFQRVAEKSWFCIMRKELDGEPHA